MLLAVVGLPLAAIGISYVFGVVSAFFPGSRFFKIKVDADVRFRDEQISWTQEAYCWPKYISFGWTGTKHRVGFQVSPKLLRKRLDDGSVVALRLLPQFCAAAVRNGNLNEKITERLPVIEWFDRENSPNSWWLYTDLLSGEGGAKAIDIKSFEVSQLDDWVTRRELESWLDNQRKRRGRGDLSRTQIRWWDSAAAIIPVYVIETYWERFARPRCANDNQFVEIVNLQGNGSLGQIFRDGGVAQNNSYLAELSKRSWLVKGIFHEVIPLHKNGDHWIADENASGSAITTFDPALSERVLQIRFSDGRALEAKRMRMYFDCADKTFFKVSA